MRSAIGTGALAKLWGCLRGYQSLGPTSPLSQRWLPLGCCSWRALLTAGLAAALVTAFVLLPPIGWSDDALVDEVYGVPALAVLLVNSSIAATQPLAERGAGNVSTVELWARGSALEGRLFDTTHVEAVRAALGKGDVAALRALCGRCLYHSLTGGYIRLHGIGAHHVFVATGDIGDQWLRDSAIQLAILLPRMRAHPALRQLVEGAIRSGAYYILHDPYANAFNSGWRPIASYQRQWRQRGRGGWVAERKFELDSGAYYFNLLWNLYNTPGLHEPSYVLRDPSVLEAVLHMLQTWEVEQHHEERSPYRFLELPRNGLGAPTNYTGMVWSAFRPSDDPQTYGYSVPSNMYAAGALSRLRTLNAAVWQSNELDARAAALVEAISMGIARHGVVMAPDGAKVYAYEVDGLGHALLDFDDPNLPSLLAMPLLGFQDYDPHVYAATRARILSSANSYYVHGTRLEGLASPHTPRRYIWPLAHMVSALTGREPRAQAELLRSLLGMQCGNGLMHESVHADKPWRCTRPVFEWANAMLVVAVEQLLGEDCELPAEEEHLRSIVRREWSRTGGARGGVQPLLSYQRLEASMRHEP